MKTVCVSGGFDPFHAGHLALIQEAIKLGTVTAIIDSDAYVASKHRLTMLQHVRTQIVRQFVHHVYKSHTTDGDCSAILREIHPDYYMVGPEYTDHTKLPEYETCKRLGIEIVTAQHEFADLHSRDFAKPKYVNPPVTVSALIKSKISDNILITRRTETGEGLELPGGFLEEGESLEMALRREIKEEADVTVGHLSYFASGPATYCDGRKILSVYFTCELAYAMDIANGSWHNSLPDAKFFAECDRQALQEYFRRKGQ